MKEEKTLSSPARPLPQQILSSSTATTTGDGAVKHEMIRGNNYRSVVDDEELWKNKKWCWERDYDRYPVNNNNTNDSANGAGIHTCIDEKKQPAVVTNNATTTSDITVVVSRTIDLLTKRNPKRPLRPDQLKLWANMFNKLIDYKKHHGHTMVPQNYEGSSQLGQWVHKQRKCHTNYDMLESRYTLLNSIGFVWENSRSIINQEEWMKMYQQLVLYKNKYKSTRVPIDYNVSNIIPLGLWVRRQRSTHTQNKLLEERFGLLDSIGFVWDARTRNSNNNNDDDDTNNNDVDDERKPAAVISTRSLLRERGDVTDTDVDINVDVHQNREGTNSIVGTTSSTTNTNQLPHCRSKGAIRPRNNSEMFSKENGEKDFVNSNIDKDINDHSFDFTTSNKKDQDIADINSDDDKNNDNDNDNDSFYDDWEEGNWSWL